MSFNRIITALNQCGMHTIKPGLARMQSACERLGHPERVRPCVHVAGTNGKGSTIAFLESILRARQYSVGIYTSPHLHDIRERIVANGHTISGPEFVAAYTEVHTACADLGLSYFEWLTLMAFVHFRTHPVDVMLLETGMGGRWDATNVVTPIVSIITTIDYDHQAYLGETLAQITAEKCGILKPHVPAVIALQLPEAMDVIQDVVGELGLHAQIVQPLSSDTPLGLAGDHQRQNAALAVAAARIVREHVTPSVCTAHHPVINECCHPERSEGSLGTTDRDFDPLATTRWPGRLEWISQDPPILCDVAHNVSGMRTIVEYLKSQFPSLPGGGLGSGGSASVLPAHPSPLQEGEGVVILLGVMSDKDAAGMVKVLSEIADTFYCVTPNTSRALPADKLAQIVREAGKTAVVTSIADMKRTWKGPDTLIVTGSFYTVGEFCERI